MNLCLVSVNYILLLAERVLLVLDFEELGAPIFDRLVFSLPLCSLICRKATYDEHLLRLHGLVEADVSLLHHSPPDNGKPGVILIEHGVVHPSSVLAINQLNLVGCHDRLQLWISNG